MPRWAICDVLQREDPLVEYRGTTVCVPCLLDLIDGSICAYDFTKPVAEERECAYCKRRGNELFRLVPHASPIGMPRSIPTPA